MATARLLRRGIVSLTLCLFALEALLQAAAAIAPFLRSAAPTAAEPGAVTIMVVGDSHAAGAGVPVEESLGGHLERMLVTRHPGRAFRVVNLGVSGVNSAYVANRLETNILVHRPRLVIIWVGVNNLWNALETETWTTNDSRLALQRFLLRSRVYRLVTVLVHTRVYRHPQDAEARRWPGGVEHYPEVAGGLAFDLERMARTAVALDTPVLFMNYPVPYDVVNVTIRTTGLRLGVPVVKTADDVWRAKSDGHALGALISFAAGPHPTGLLYRYVAESTVPHVEAILRHAGVDLGSGTTRLDAP